MADFDRNNLQNSLGMDGLMNGFGLNGVDIKLKYPFPQGMRRLTGI